MDNKVPQQINDIVGDNVKKLAVKSMSLPGLEKRMQRGLPRKMLLEEH